MSVELFSVIQKHCSHSQHLFKQVERLLKEEKRQQRGGLGFHAIKARSQCFALQVERLH